MADHDATGSLGPTTHVRSGVGRLPRRVVFGVATGVTLLPIWVLAVRVGTQGLIPVGDTAIMALRAPDVFSANPPLVGMPASSASATDLVHFPGAWQLYWLAGPVKVLGPTWGSVVAMGALSSIWVGLAIWLAWRNLETAQALVVIGAIGVFCWSIGAGMLIDAWPLRMVIVPFLCVVVAAWFTAAGDRAALVVLAVAANYAWLDHLVLGIAVPLVALVGCVGFLVGHLRAVRATPEDRDRLRRRFRRSVLTAGAVTLIMWLPALIQQFARSPGNLELVLTGSDGAAPPIRSWTASLHVVASVIGHPPFWLRGTLDDPAFYRADRTGHAIGSATWADLGVAVVLVVVLTVLGVATFRRRDRTGVALVATAVTAVVASAVTTYLAPTTTAVVPEYLFSVWVTGMIVWVCILVAAIRLLRREPAPVIAWVGLTVTAVFGVANLAVSHTGYTTRPSENVLARQLSDVVIEAVDGVEPVGVKMANLFDNANYLSALLVQMDRAGVVFCYPTPNTSLYDFIPDCDDPAATVVFAEHSARRPPSGDVLFTAPVLPGAWVTEGVEVTETELRLEAWLASRSSLSLTEAAQRPFLGDLIPRQLRSRVRALEPSDGHLGRLVDDPDFVELITVWWERADARTEPLFVDQPVSPAELYRWARATRDAETTLWVTLES